MKRFLLIALYFVTLAAGFISLASDGALVERLILSDASYARTQEERERIVTVASATRLGIEYYPQVIYITAAKLAAYGLGTLITLSLLTTLLFLYYSEMTGSPLDYATAFITPLWILVLSNILTPCLKLLVSRLYASLSLVLFIRPFDWSDPWQVFLGRMDVFFIAYLIMVGIGCSATAKIRKCEAVMLVAIIWFAMYFSAVILGIDLAVSF